MPKLLLPLTQAAVNKAVAAPNRSQRVDLRDGAVPGLRLRLSAQGQVWELAASRQGRRMSFSLGQYPAMSLQQARKAAADRKEALKTAVGVLNDVPGSPSSLNDLIALYEVRRGRTLKAWPEAERSMRRVFAPLLETPLLRLDGFTVQRAVDAYPSGSCGAHAMRALRPILKWARKRGFVLFNAGELELPTHNRTPRTRVLDKDELSAVLRALTTSPYDSAMKVMLYTLCRRSEVTEALWDEFDFEARIWTVPARRMKNGKPHTVPLTDDVIRILDALPRKSTYVFGQRLNNWTRAQAKIFDASGTSAWHRHDLRRTAATTLGELGVPPHIIEIALSHTHAHSQLASIYNRTRYFEEHRDALQKLAEYYATLM